MVANIVEGRFGPKPPDDLAVRLREIADAVERGEITQVVATYIHEDKYINLWAASIETALAMSCLQQTNALERLRS